jgi:hypothetical protein
VRAITLKAEQFSSSGGKNLAVFVVELNAEN